MDATIDFSNFVFDKQGQKSPRSAFKSLLTALNCRDISASKKKHKKKILVFSLIVISKGVVTVVCCIDIAVNVKRIR